MQCPVDGTTPVMSDRQGVEIDYCPTCRGVWLDRGELDKIIERSAPGPVPAPAPPPSPPRADQPFRDSHDAPRHQKKRGSFLDDIFDF